MSSGALDTGAANSASGRTKFRPGTATCTGLSFRCLAWTYPAPLPGRKPVEANRGSTPGALVRALASVQRRCCTHAASSCFYVITAVLTGSKCASRPLTTYGRLVLTSARDSSQTYFEPNTSSSANACSDGSPAAAKRGSCWRPRPGETEEGRVPDSTAGRRRGVAAFNGVQGTYCRYGGDVRMYMIPWGRGKCEGKQPDSIWERQHRRAIACCCKWSNSGRSATDRARRISGDVRPPGEFITTIYSCRIVGWFAQKLPSGGAPQGKSFRPENEGLLKQPSCYFLFRAPHHSRFTGDSGLRASFILSANRSAAVGELQQQQLIAPPPQFCAVPGVDHAAGGREQTRTQQQCFLGQQVLAAGVSVPSTLLQAPAGAVESQWPATGTCPLSYAVRPNLTYTELKSEGSLDERKNKQYVIQCRGDDELSNPGKRRELEKCPEGHQREVRLVPRRALALLSPPPVRLYRDMTLLTMSEAANAVAAPAEWTISLARSTAFRAARQANLSLLANTRQYPHRGAGSEHTLRGGFALARITVVRRAGISRLCTAATGSETTVTTEREPSPGTERFSGAVKLPGVADSATARLAEDWVFTAPRILATRLTPAGLLRRQVGALGFYTAELQQQQLHGHFAATLPVSPRWTLPAFYASSSTAAVDLPGIESRSTRAPNQLSRKALKGLQGHPRRYQLMGGRPEFHHIDRNRNGHIIEPTDKFQVVVTTSKNNVHVQVLNKSRAYRTIFGSFAGNVGYRKRAQQEPRCAYRIGQNIARKCRRLGICQVDLKFRRVMRVEQLLQAFAAHGLGVTSVTHEPRLPKCGQNSTKPRKRRRV